MKMPKNHAEGDMRKKSFLIAIAIATGLLVTGAVAQHEEHHQDPAAPLSDKAGKTGGEMSGDVMSQMPQIIIGQGETAKLVDQLTKSFAAIEAEKDSAKLKEKLAEHGSLLKELQTKVQAQTHMMERMQHMMGGTTIADGYKN
jgi:hypothetical protein